MSSPFGDLLVSHWRTLGITQADFCRRIGSPAGWIQQVKEAKKTPPLERMPDWAKALKLKAKDAAYFEDCAAIMHIPAAHREHVYRIVAEWHGVEA